MPVPPATRERLLYHLGQAEFSLRVAANFACLLGTPTRARLRETLAQVEEAKSWVREKLAVETAPAPRPEPFAMSGREKQRIVARRMARP